MIIPPDRKISTSIVGFWNFPSNLMLRFKKIPFFDSSIYKMKSICSWLNDFISLSSPSFCNHDKLIFFLRCRFQCIRNINQFKTKSAVLRQTTCALSWERDQEKKNMIKLISICRLNYITNFNIIGSDRKSKVQTLDCLRCVGWCLAFHNNERILVRYLIFNVETK